MAHNTKSDDNIFLEKITFFHEEAYVSGQAFPNLDTDSILKNSFGSMSGNNSGIVGNNAANILATMATFLLVPLHWSGLLFESFLHIKFGRLYISPIFIFVSFLLFLFILIVSGEFIGMFVGVSILAANSYIIYQMPIFIALATILALIHYFYAIIDYKNHPRHSRSNGVPWVYTLTGHHFFLSLLYVFYIQPALFILSAVFLYLTEQKEFATVLIILSSMYLLRNIISHQIIYYEDIKRNDARIMAEYQEALHRLEERGIKKILAKNMKEEQSNNTNQNYKMTRKEKFAV